MPNVALTSDMNSRCRPHRKTRRLATAVVQTALVAAAFANPQCCLRSRLGSCSRPSSSTPASPGALMTRAQTLLREAVNRDDPLARMWLARCHSRGRMGFVADLPKARALAAAEIATVEQLAGAGVLEAVFLMATAFDEGLGRPDVRSFRSKRQQGIDPQCFAAGNQARAERRDRHER
jgi:hypothetical protein